MPDVALDRPRDLERGCEHKAQANLIKRGEGCSNEEGFWDRGKGRN